MSDQPEMTADVAPITNPYEGDTITITPGEGSGANVEIANPKAIVNVTITRGGPAPITTATLRDGTVIYVPQEDR